MRASTDALPRMAPASQEKAISAPVLRRCRRVIAPMSRSGCFSATRSIIWPPTMPLHPAAMRQRGDQFAPHRGIAMGVGLRQHLEGQGQETVARQHRGRLVEGLVAGRTAAPQIAVVHRRQIVVDQRIGMHHLDRAAACNALRRATEKSCALASTRNGPQPLARRQRGIAHRLEHPRLEAVGTRRSGVRATASVSLRGVGERVGEARARRPESSVKGHAAPSQGVPSAPITILSTRACASRSLASQCRFNSAPRS